MYIYTTIKILNINNINLLSFKNYFKIFASSINYGLLTFDYSNLTATSLSVIISFAIYMSPKDPHPIILSNLNLPANLISKSVY